KRVTWSKSEIWFYGRYFDDPQPKNLKNGKLIQRNSLLRYVVHFITQVITILNRSNPISLIVIHNSVPYS
ncbi:unnamed protein product, partial [Amoebophrya sp. A25]